MRYIVANSPKIESVILYTYDNDTFTRMLIQPMTYVKEVRLCLNTEELRPYLNATQCKKLFPHLEYFVSCPIIVSLLCFKDKCVKL